MGRYEINSRFRVDYRRKSLEQASPPLQARPRGRSDLPSPVSTLRSESSWSLSQHRSGPIFPFPRSQGLEFSAEEELALFLSWVCSSGWSAKRGQGGGAV